MSAFLSFVWVIPVQKNHTAIDVGDEPLLLARHAPVWVSAGRDDGARAARSHGASVIVMDDGHQNPQLEKTLSLLVVDAEVGFGNGCVFPAGPLREKLTPSLERADAVILMKPSPDYEIDEVLTAQLKGKIVIPAYLAPAGPPPKGKLTTEKDYVRLPKGYRKGVHAWPVSVQFEDELTLRRLLHPIIEKSKPRK